MARFRSDTVRNAMMVGLSNTLGTDVFINIRTGPPSGVPAQGTLLAVLRGDSTAWAPAPVGGVLTSNTIVADAAADDTGIAGHYELLTSAGDWVESAIIDQAGTDGVTIANVNVVVGQPVQVIGNWVNTASYDDGV